MHMMNSELIPGR